MIRLITCIGVLLGVFILVIIGASIVALLEYWVEDQDRLEMQLKIEETMRRLTPPWIASGYLSRIEKASVEILSQKKPVDKIIVLWWGLDGLRLNEDGRTEWISRKQPEPEPVNQNVFYNPPQSICIEDVKNLINYQSMCQNTQAHIQALQDSGRICATAQIHQMQMQLPRPPLQMIYPYGYIPFPQYPYAQHYQGNLTGCCCDGSILR